MAPQAEPDFDVIVVGAGIAGCVTAILLARAGRQVVLIERGATAGSKNLSGGVLYCRVLEDVFPNLLTDAPVERRITRNVIQFLNADSAVAVDYADARLAEPTNAVTVLRATLDAWLADQCEAEGVFVMTGVRVDALLTEDGGITGVRAGEDELHARVVVAADGVNSFLSKQAGLRPATDPLNHLAVGVKGVVSLPEQVLVDRFHLTGDEGVAYAIVGDCTQGIGGGGFLYTNRASISLGVVLRLDDLTRSGKAASDVYDHFVSHPYIAPLLEGGELVEYGCHLVSEGGLHGMGEIVTDGMVVVGDAAGLTLNTGLTVRGMDLAAASGIAAAKAIDESLATSDTSKAGLEPYRRYLLDSFAGKDLQTYVKAPSFLERSRLYADYGPLLADILHEVFDQDLTPRRHLASVARDAFRGSPVRTRDLLADGLAGVRAL